jgi:hypothetical protein
MKSKTHFLTDLNLNSILEPADPQDKNYCATKVVGTIGPACQAVDKQVAMLEAGMACARCATSFVVYRVSSRSNQTQRKSRSQTTNKSVDFKPVWPSKAKPYKQRPA